MSRTSRKEGLERVKTTEGISSCLTLFEKTDDDIVARAAFQRAVSLATSREELELVSVKLAHLCGGSLTSWKYLRILFARARKLKIR